MRSIQLISIVLAITISVCTFSFSHAQVPNPVKWSFTANKINSTTYELHMTATIDAGWRLYAQEANDGTVPTTFKITKNPLVAPTGKIQEIGKLQQKFDSDFNANLRYYENKVDFVQKVTVKGNAATTVKGSVEFRVRDARQSLPPKQVEFSIKVGGS